MPTVPYDTPNERYAVPNPAGINVNTDQPGMRGLTNPADVMLMKSPPTVAPMAKTEPGVDYSGKQLIEQGRASQAFGAAVMQIADQIQQSVDDARTKELDTQFSDKLRQVMYDPEKGYMATVGKNALESRDATIKAITEARQELEKGVANPVQQKMFTNIANRRMDHALQQMDAHALQQTKVYNIGESKARLEASVYDAIENAGSWSQRDREGNPTGAYNQFKQTALAEANVLADLSGLPHDSAQRKSLLMEVTTKLHTSVVQNMVAKDNTGGAAAYLSAAMKAKEIDPTKTEQLLKLVNVSNDKDAALRLTMGLEGTFEEKRETLNQLYKDGKINSKVLDAAMNRVEHNFNVEKAIAAEAEKKMLTNSFTWISENPGKSIEDMPTSLLASLKESTHFPQVLSFSKSNGKVETDDETYYGLRMMSTDKPLEFAKMDLMTVRGKLSKPDFDRLVEVQANINKNDIKGMELNKVVTGTVSAIKADIQAIGIDLTPKEGSEKAKRTAKFMNELSRSLDEAQTKKGSSLTPQEARRIGTDLLKEGWLQGSGLMFDTKVRRFELTPDQKAETFVTTRFDDIPASIREEIQKSQPKASKLEVERIYQRARDEGRIK